MARLLINSILLTCKENEVKIKNVPVENQNLTQNKKYPLFRPIHIWLKEKLINLNSCERKYVMIQYNSLFKAICI